MHMVKEMMVNEIFVNLNTIKNSYKAAINVSCFGDITTE